jgi:hypothetical protein
MQNEDVQYLAVELLQGITFRQPYRRWIHNLNKNLYVAQEDPAFKSGPVMTATAVLPQKANHENSRKPALQESVAHWSSSGSPNTFPEPHFAP